MLDRLREIERELGISPQIARATAAGLVREEGLASGDLTQVLPSTGAATTAPVDSADNATRLRQATRRRSAKGGWLVALVVVLAALAGGAGWWFSSGPGSLVVVADVSGGTYSDAQARLLQDTLITVERQETSLDVPAGAVIRTDPAAGDRVDRDASIDVYVSQGPAEASFASFLGKTEADARTILGDQFVDVGDENAEFFTDAEPGTVIGVLIRPAGAPEDGSQDVPCGEGCSVRQGDSATLWLSVGAVPDVAGQSVGDATSTLNGAGLQIAGTVEESSDSLADGLVIRLADREGGGSWQPGNSVTLVVSSGPPLFPVPNVVGLSLAQAKTRLAEAGFSARYNPLWEPFALIATVVAQDPEADAQRVKGTAISLDLSATD